MRNAFARSSCCNNRWPAALDDLSCALRQQFEPGGATEFTRPIGRPGMRNLDESLSVFVEHGRRQRHLRAVDRGKSRDRGIAMTVEHPQHLAFSFSAAARGEVIDLRQKTPRRPIV